MIGVAERTTIDEVLQRARRTITRLTPAQAAEAHAGGAPIVDLRDEMYRRREGIIPGSIHVPLSILPWRADPGSESSDDRINDLDRQLVLVCNDGYSSSLAAALLVELGFTRVGDMVGGYRGWVAAGFPVERMDPSQDR